MLITYFVFLILAIDFKLSHWPGTSILFLLSTLFPFIGLIISIVRVKQEGIQAILKFTSVFLISLFLLFKFLYWPGSTLLFIPAFIVTTVYIVNHFLKKHLTTISFYIVVVLLLFTTVNFFLPKSSFRLLYLTEDPFNPDEPVPHFIIQRLAFDFYQEGQYDKAEQLIERNLNHIEQLLQQEQITQWSKWVDAENYIRTKNDYQQIKNKTWGSYVPLIPEDRNEP